MIYQTETITTKLNKMKKIETTKLRNGANVLSRLTKWGLSAYTYANDTQAYKKQNELRNAGVNCRVIQPNFAVRFIEII